MKKSFNTQKVYTFLSLVTLTACTAALLLSGGRLFQVFFFTDPNDTFMDFYNSLIEASTGRPYTDFNVLYPPLANLFFFILSLFIPGQIRAGWPKTHFDVQGMVGTAKDIRLNQSALMIFLLVFIISLFIIAVLIHSVTKSYLTTFSLTFSAGILSGLERGNVILIAFILVLLFLKYYKDEKSWKRELALISLAAAFGFKLYPAFFGLLLLRDKKFAAAARAILYAILLTIIPALLMGEAGELLPWLQMILGRSAVSATAADTPVSAEASSFISVSMILTLTLLIILVIDILFRNVEKIRFNPFLSESEFLFLLCTAMVLFSHMTGGYILVFYLIPFTLFIKEEPVINRYNLAEFLVYLAALLPYGINNLSYPILLLFGIGIVIRHVFDGRAKADMI